MVVQGAGSSDAYVTSFSLQFSLDGLRWHSYRESAAPGHMAELKVQDQPDLSEGGLLGEGDSPAARERGQEVSALLCACGAVIGGEEAV